MGEPIIPPFTPKKNGKFGFGMPIIYKQNIKINMKNKQTYECYTEPKIKFGVEIIVEYSKNGKLKKENLTLPFFLKNNGSVDKRINKLVIDKISKILEENKIDNSYKSKSKTEIQMEKLIKKWKL